MGKWDRKNANSDSFVDAQFVASFHRWGRIPWLFAWASTQLEELSLNFEVESGVAPCPRATGDSATSLQLRFTGVGTRPQLQSRASGLCPNCDSRASGGDDDGRRVMMQPPQISFNCSRATLHTKYRGMNNAQVTEEGYCAMARVFIHPPKMISNEFLGVFKRNSSIF